MNESDLRGYFRRGGALAFEASACGPMIEHLERMSCDSSGDAIESRQRKASRAWDHAAGVSRARVELERIGIGVPDDWDEQVEREDPALTADYLMETRNVAVLPHEVQMCQNAEVERILALAGRRYVTALALYYGPAGDDCVRSVPLGRLLPVLQMTEAGQKALAARAKRHSSQRMRDPMPDAATRLDDEYSQNAQWPDETRTRMLRAAEDEARQLVAEARAAVLEGE